MMHQKWNRRKLIQSFISALGVGSLGLLQGSMSSASTASERKFLFIFCEGGWDQCALFAPLWGIHGIDMEPESTLGQIGGIDFVDSAVKPSVREFLQRYGNETCFVNGIEVRSVAHETATRLISTGTASTHSNDWASRIAANAISQPLMPSVVMSGPSYADDFTAYVARVGANGQLGSLMDSTNFTDPNVDALEDSWLEQLHDTYQEEMGRHADIRGKAQRAESTLQDIQDIRNRIDLQTEEIDGFTGRLTHDLDIAVKLLSEGICRCVSVKHFGWQNLGYDSHAFNSVQSRNFQEVFSSLLEMYAQINIRYPSLRENLTVVLLSEMGRFPTLNMLQGKTHWMHTSCVLIGSGIRGNQVVGAYTDEATSSPIDLQTGEVTSSGTYLLPSNIGTTLFQLADTPIPPELASYKPIEAVIE